MMDALIEVRKEINEVDQEIAALFERRMRAVEKISAYKRAHGLPVLDAGREAQVLQEGAACIKDPALREYYVELLKKLMSVSRAYQEQKLTGFSVGYQGTEGAFSQVAAKRIFAGASLRPFVTFEEVFEAVRSGKVSIGVLPFENSYAGEVGGVLDLLWQYEDCMVVGAYDLHIRHSLLALPEATIEDIRQVYSHHQAISQCQMFLEKYPFDLIPYANTALAAKYVSECKDKTKAAIASADTAALYGLSIVEANINSSKENTTRFIVVSKAPLQKGDRFGILFTVRHDAGALASAIRIIGEKNFNLECIRSRPMKSLSWKYFFYVEIIGDASSAAAKEMLCELHTVCSGLRIVGQWERSDI